MRTHSVPAVLLAAALVSAPAVAEGSVPGTDRDGAAAAVAAAPDAESAEPRTTGDVRVRWQSRSLTDYWSMDTDADGRSTSVVETAISVEHRLDDTWRVFGEVDGWFDADDARWSSSWADSIAFVGAVRGALSDAWEVELGGRWDDWNELQSSGGDPWGVFATLSWTTEAWGGELTPYVYHELRNRIDGADHDGSWITEAGAEFEAPLADAWTFEAAALGARIDGSTSDPDVWALVARAGLRFAVSERSSVGVIVEATRSDGAALPGRTIGTVAVEWAFRF